MLKTPTGHLIKSSNLTPNTHVIPTDFSGNSGWLEEDIFRQWNHLHFDVALFVIVSILKSSFRKKKSETACFPGSVQFHLLITIYFFLERGSLQGKGIFFMIANKEHT